MDVFGHVIDKATNVSLPGVNIAVRDQQGRVTGQGTTTNNQGFFDLRNVPVGHTVNFTFIGYKPQAPLLREFPLDNDILMETDTAVVPEATAQAKKTYYRYYVAAALIVGLYFLLFYKK